jgi:pSer/pThr/pTyr-binding forkhead associated (FHA) protein
MDYLEITDSQGRRRRIPLDQPRLVIGREHTCDIFLPHPNVSRRHAQVQQTEQGRWMLQDLNSVNHVYVDNRPVKQIVLQPGHPVRIAEYQLRLCDATTEPQSGQEGGTQPAVGPDESWTNLEPGRLEQLQLFQRTEGGDDEIANEAADSSGGYETTSPAFPKTPNGSGMGPAGFALVSAQQQDAVEEECWRIREKLEVNHVFYNRAELNELPQQLLEPTSRAWTILGTGFHRLVVLDAAQGLDVGTRQFDLQRFLLYVHGQLARAFHLHFEDNTYHLENIAQVLKDEPRSLFCFLNLQHVPIGDFPRLRGFTQGLHQTLFLCCGDRDLVAEERAYVQRTTRLPTTAGRSAGSA